jgi:carboxylesterase type B
MVRITALNMQFLSSANKTLFVPLPASTIGPDPSGKKTLLAHQISRFVMSFIATGDPNNAKLDNKVDKWPTYNTSDPKNYYFNKEDTHIEADDWRKEAINFTNYEVGHQLYN